MHDSQTPNEFTLLRQVIEHLQKIHDDSRTPLNVATEIYPKIQELAEKERELRGKAFTAASIDGEYQKAVEALNAVNNMTKAQDHANNLKIITGISNSVAAVLDLAIAVGKLAAV